MFSNQAKILIINVLSFNGDFYCFTQALDVA